MDSTNKLFNGEESWDDTSFDTDTDFSDLDSALEDFAEDEGSNDSSVFDDMDIGDDGEESTVFSDMGIEDSDTADSTVFSDMGIDDSDTDDSTVFSDMGIEDTDEQAANFGEDTNGDYESDFSEEVDDPSNFEDGVPINDDLHDSSEDADNNRTTDFISDTGSIIVQEASDDKENGFELIYVDIDKIAITNRIRKIASVESLVQSIQSTGLLKPLVVAPTATDGLFVLLDGYRRIQACARAGKTRVPCIVNNRVSTPEIPILEAMYNHSKDYSIKEQIDYIDYLEKQKGIMNPTMIEYLLQMDSGDYTKLKDILHDDDENIVSKLLDGQYTIATAFKKLEQRRRKESNEEKENKKAERVYGDEQKSGVDQIDGTGEEADGEALTEEQISKLAFNANNLDDSIEDKSINDMIEEDNNIEGFEPHKQKVGEREYIDPIIKKTVMARDNSTCRCCKRGGEQYVDILDFHHVLPVYLGGADTPENGIMLCVACHRLVHLYSTGDLHIDNALMESNYSELSEEQKSRYENEQIFEDEKNRFKRIIVLGSKIRQGIAMKGMNREQFKKEHSNNGIGRRKPGKNAQQEMA